MTLLTGLYGIGTFAMLGVSPLSPFIVEAFGLTRGQVGLLVPVVYCGGLLFCLPAGRLVDRFDPSVCLTGGLILGGVALTVAAASPTFETLLGFLLVAGIGWIFVNPALSRAIFLLFAASERGFAMGVKQTGQTLGGIAGALILPLLAHSWGWRRALGVTGAAMVLLVILSWRPLRRLPYHDPLATGQSVAHRSRWWWLRRPAILVFLGTGVGLGMGQSALLSYLPLFATQSLGLSAVGAGGLLGLAQAGGAAGRLAFGAASDRWFKGRRVPSLVLISAVTAGSFLLLAGSLLTSPTLAAVAVFGAGVGALGWVGLYMVLAAELGGPRHAGLMSGASLAFLLTGILAGGPLFGFVLERADSYTHAWTVFALIAALVGAALWAGGTAIHHECRRATDDEHGRA